MSKRVSESSLSMLVSQLRSLALSRILIVSHIELEEDGVRIALTIVDTPGFGDNIDNEFAYVISFSIFGCGADNYLL